MTDLADLTDGSSVVIYHPATKKAVTSETYQDWYLLLADAEVENEQIAEPAENTVWTVHLDENGSYSFTQDKASVTAWLSGNYVEVSNGVEAHEGSDNAWKLDVCNAENGTFYMRSASLTVGEKGAYGEVYNKKVNGESMPVFCGFSSTPDRLNEKDYGMQFYLVASPEQPVTPTGNTYGLASRLSDGDEVILYNAKNGVGLGNAIASHKITGVELAPENGVITTDNEAVLILKDLELSVRPADDRIFMTCI